MGIDIRTLILIIGLSHIIQVVVFAYQYVINKAYKGIGWWLLWCAMEVIGFSAMLLRNIPYLLFPAIIIQNTAIIAGILFIYIGIKRFFGQKENTRLIILFYSAFILVLLFFLFIRNDIHFRSAFISAVVALISFVTATALLRSKVSSVRATALFNGIVFLIHGVIFTLRFVWVVIGFPSDEVFEPSWINILTYLDGLIVGLAWTFGLVIMLNQRLNAEISEARSRFELIFNTSPDAVLITTKDNGKIIDHNQSFTALTGYSREESIGMSTLDLAVYQNPADREFIVSELRKKGRFENLELRFRKKDGSELIGLMSATTLLLGGDPFILSVTRDITRRKRDEEEIKRLKRLYAMLSQTNQAIVRIKDREQLFRETCHMAVEFGEFRLAWISMLDATGNNLVPFYHAGSDATVILKELFKIPGERCNHFPGAKAFWENRVVACNDIRVAPEYSDWNETTGDYNINSFAAAPIRLGNSVIGLFVLYASETDFFGPSEIRLLHELGVDISFALEMYSLEEKRKKLEKERALLHHAIEKSRNEIYIFDASSLKFRFINSGALENIGYSLAEMQEMTPLNIKPEITKEQFAVLTGQLISREKDLQLFETVHRRKNGTLYPCEVRLQFFEYENDRIFLAVIEDISERNRIMGKLKESDRLKSVFLANMSHEIRTPMNAIVGFAQLLSEPSTSDEDKGRFSNIIQSRSGDLMHIINELLDISRIESGNATIIKDKVELNSLLDDITVISEEKIRKSRKSSIVLQCVKPFPAKKLSFITDPYILKQVFTNLIDNAVKYTHEGSIRIGYRPPEDGFITCFVSDSGIGITPENQQIIFDHFRQADIDDIHRYGGTGLGLSICRGSLELLGGDIRVESEPGIGSTFLFRVPFSLIREIPSEGRPRPETGKAGSSINWKGKNILLVEDEPSNMEYLQIVLRSTGASLTSVYSGEQVRDLHKEIHKFDLVLLDIRLPDANGWDLAREIKALRPGLTVIAQTGYAMSSDRIKSEDAGCDNFISKPINRDHLLSMLDSYLGQAAGE